MENTSLIMKTSSLPAEACTVYRPQPGRACKAVVGTRQVRYLKGDEWREIDNTLAADGAVWRNAESPLTVTFPASVTADSDYSVHVSYEGHALSWTLPGL